METTDLVNYTESRNESQKHFSTSNKRSFEQISSEDNIEKFHKELTTAFVQSMRQPLRVEMFLIPIDIDIARELLTNFVFKTGMKSIKVKFSTRFVDRGVVSKWYVAKFRYALGSFEVLFSEKEGESFTSSMDYTNTCFEFHFLKGDHAVYAIMKQLVLHQLQSVNCFENMDGDNDEKNSDGEDGIAEFYQNPPSIWTAVFESGRGIFEDQHEADDANAYFLFRHFRKGRVSP